MIDKLYYSTMGFILGVLITGIALELTNPSDNTTIVEDLKTSVSIEN